MARHHRRSGGSKSHYRARAERHEKAARKATGYKREGHLEVAEGYHKLAAVRGEARHASTRKKGRKKKRGRGGRFR